MKKIILSIICLLIISIFGYVSAQESTTGTPSNQYTTQNVDISCMAKAVAKREAAIQTNLSTFSSSMLSAFQVRASALATAWTNTDKTTRNAAIKDAWSKFTQAKTAARKAYNAASNSSWTQFVTDRKSCKAGPTGENPASDSL